MRRLARKLTSLKSHLSDVYMSFPMLGHERAGEISLICPHPYSQQIVIGTMHQNVIIFDMAKNRSVRQFSVPERGLIAWA
jgi:hypothetical protein